MFYHVRVLSLQDVFTQVEVKTTPKITVTPKSYSSTYTQINVTVYSLYNALEASCRFKMLLV